MIVPPTASADDFNLPDIGNPADSVLSRSEEARLGRAIMAQIRAQGAVVEDPLVTEYINDVGKRIAVQSNDGQQEFNFFVIRDPRINAFALPGGFIGVHTGLLEATRNEDELAGVLAHEVAHVTQRHIARAIHASQRQSIISTALMLGAILAGVASGDGEVIEAGVMVGQGVQVQQQINFTRHNEYEADRIGIAALADAGFDPYGMASFFEVMARLQPSDPNLRIPEFLSTHPVSTARVAEARNRAGDYPRINSDDSKNYGIARARMIVDRFDTPEAAIAYWEARNHDYAGEIDRYGLAIAYQRDGRHAEAARLYEELLANDQTVIAYHMGLADAQLSRERYDVGLAGFERAVRLFPRNVPLVILYAEWLMRLEQPARAHATLLDLLNNVPPTPEQVRLIARAAGEAGETAESLYYLSEYELMTGDLIGGIRFLQQALRLPDLQEIQRARFEARIDFIREFMSEEQLKQLQRSRTAGLVR